MTQDIPKAASTTPTQRALIVCFNLGSLLQRICGVMEHQARINVNPDGSGNLQHDLPDGTHQFNIGTFAYGGLYEEVCDWLDGEHAALAGIVIEEDNPLLDPLRERIMAECGEHNASVEANAGGVVIRHGSAVFVVPFAQLEEPAIYAEAGEWLTARHAEEMALQVPAGEELAPDAADGA